MYTRKTGRNDENVTVQEPAMSVKLWRRLSSKTLIYIQSNMWRLSSAQMTFESVEEVKETLMAEVKLFLLRGTLEADNRLRGFSAALW